MCWDFEMLVVSYLFSCPGYETYVSTANSKLICTHEEVDKVSEIGSKKKKERTILESGSF